MSTGSRVILVIIFIPAAGSLERHHGYEVAALWNGGCDAQPFEGVSSET